MTYVFQKLLILYYYHWLTIFDVSFQNFSNFCFACVIHRWRRITWQICQPMYQFINFKLEFLHSLTNLLNYFYKKVFNNIFLKIPISSLIWQFQSRKMSEIRWKWLKKKILFRRLYWANSNWTNPSIERSNLDGRNRVQIITEKLYEPTAIAIDHKAGQLYWLDDEEGIHYKLERSNLDGTERKLLVHDRHQQPVSLALDKDNIYWTDYSHSAVWSIGKVVKAGDLPKKLRDYYNENREDDPTNVISRYNAGDGVDCKAVKSQSLNVPPPPKPPIEPFNNLTSSSEELDFNKLSAQFSCSNNGLYDVVGKKCLCHKG